MELGSYRGTGPRIKIRRRADLGRKLTRRLSMVVRVPAAMLHRTNHPDPRPIEITAIAPDMTQLTVSITSIFFLINFFYESNAYSISLYVHYLADHVNSLCIVLEEK